MTRVPLLAHVQGIGFWASGLPGWDAARAFVRDGTRPEAAPARPAPQLLAPNERRRAPETVAVALEAALAACHDAGADPATLPSVFASAHGEQAVTDYLCRSLASEPAALSPIRFHNSVHNAAAGYWTIGAGAHAPATALAAGPASFAQALLEALGRLACGDAAVLVVGYDGPGVEPLAQVAPSTGLLGGALVLAGTGSGPALRFALGTATAAAAAGPLAQALAGNAMAPMLPLFDLLAGAPGTCTLDAGPGLCLAVTA